jgi:hypothetical protein
MYHVTIQTPAPHALAAVMLVVLASLGAMDGRASYLAPADAPQAEGKTTFQSTGPGGNWRAFGRVTDQDGRPFAGVEVSAHCGAGTLRRTGVATSGTDGRYELSFGPGVRFPKSSPTAAQAATLAAHKPGFFEEDLNRQGNCLAAEKMPDEKTINGWGRSKERVFLPDRPIELNFVMRPAGRVAGKLIDEQGKPLVGYSVALAGPELPPSSNVLCWAQVDNAGRFALEDIPTTYRFQFEVRMANPKPPWDDSWASSGLRFERPSGKDNLRAWFGDREIRLREFVLRVAGPGVHGRTATPTAGNAGLLDITTADPSDILERNDRRLVAKSAMLTLWNSPTHGAGRSLIVESVPIEPADESDIRLARSRPNNDGEFTISFENPRDCDLAPGKHQVIFQVFVGLSQTPIREKIFRQLPILAAGRYRVPVKISPKWIDDSRVSITFVSIQPDHDAWVKSFFHDGKGTTYSGIWTSEGGILPAIPVATQDAK